MDIPTKIKPRVSILILIVLSLIYFTLIWPWMMHWGATSGESNMPLPGDELAPPTVDQSTRAITVHAPATEIWQWMVQLGQDRAGFYSQDWLENLFLADIHNSDQIHPEWQQMENGDLVRGASANYLGGAMGHALGWHPPIVEPNHEIYLWGPFILQSLDFQTSRLIIRTPTPLSNPIFLPLLQLIYDPLHFVMERGMLLGIQARAEGNPPPALYWTLAVAIGWVLGFLSTLLLLLSTPGKQWGLIFPGGLFILVLWQTGDIRAAAAGFISLGFSLAGFLRFGFSWWTWYVLIAAYVLLVLILVEDSFAAFGFTFLAVNLTLIILNFKSLKSICYFKNKPVLKV